ncbi:hypothetical protein FisN_6Lh144 [Fistulifera solaris]|uniref:Uncharacterized protein n=1 Tax=Fistulifera solaris TaxID=1519565 RepID=A0A1Z5J650_FISSO|nr:hypothetical protein FisN_6Lh144 [Fistulifera solaris]|eukprot:GAX09477.1 hypothetical protein FisN_6Lh144 [Fistulifera solaris]
MRLPPRCNPFMDESEKRIYAEMRRNDKEQRRRRKQKKKYENSKSPWIVVAIMSYLAYKERARLRRKERERRAEQRASYRRRQRTMKRLRRMEMEKSRSYETSVWEDFRTYFANYPW